MQAVGEAFELSALQRRGWTRREETSWRNTQIEVRVSGELDPERLESSLARVAERHEILSTRFGRRAGLRLPLQVVGAPEIEWETSDLSALEVGEQASRLEGLRASRRSRRLGRDEGPTLGAVLVNLGDHHRLFLTASALALDTGSARRLVRELACTYDGAGGELAQEPLQYADYAAWLDETPEDETVVSEELALAWEQAKALTVGDLYGEVARGATAKSTGACLQLESGVLERAFEAAEAEGAAGESWLATAWLALLARLSGREAVFVAEVLDGRSDSELEDGLGLYSRALPIGLGIRPSEAFRNLVARLERERGLVESRQDAMVLDEASNRGACSFVFESVALGEAVGAGARFEATRVASDPEPYAVKLVLMHGPDRARAELRFDAARCEASEAQLLADQLQCFLRSVTEDPGRRIGAAALIGDDEARLVAECSHGGAVEPPREGIHVLVEERARSTPDRVAAVAVEEALSYGELDRRAERLARELRELDLGLEARIGLLTERTPSFLVGLLGILKAGGAYVPLDAAFPPRRIALLLEQADATALVTELPTPPALPGSELPVVRVPREATPDLGSPGSPAGPDSLAYVLFTSGSTGRPKGVAIEHGHLVSYLRAVSRQIDPECERYALVSTLAADLGNTVIFASLLSGGCLHFVSEDRASDPHLLAEYVSQRAIDCSKIVPSHLAAHLGAGRRSVLPRRQLILGGEASSWRLIEEVHDASPTLAILNHYGPTEATVGVTTFAVRGGRRSAPEAGVPIGRPLSGKRCYVMSSELHLLPLRVSGELHLGGDSLARGYWGDPRQTADRFRPDPVSGQPGARLYRTGDRCRLRPGGDLEFLGRVDDQVKVRGFRIEIGEIETAIRRHPAIRSAAVAVRREEGQEAILEGYFVSSERAPVELDELRRHLDETLPTYMVPSRLVCLERLPLTANGKVDRRALLSSEAARDQRIATAVERSPANLVELRLVQIWEELLGISPIAVTDNFFDAGGHSLLAVRLMARVERWTGQRIPLATLLAGPTIAEMAKLLGEGLPADPSPLVPIQPRGDRTPFFGVHPMGGEVLCYYPLSRALGLSQPFFGLQASSPEASGKQEAIEEMALRYTRAICEMQPQGPYLLGGYSFGSKVAFAIAHELLREGREVALLALLDGGAPGKAAKLDEIDEAIFAAQGIREEARQVGKEFSIDFGEILNRPDHARLAYVIEAAKAQQLLPPEVDLGWVRRLLAGIAERQRAAALYSPEPYPGPVTLFRSTRDDEDFSETLADAGFEVGEPTKGWQRFASREIEIVEIDAHHETLLRPPAVFSLAAQLGGKLHRIHESLGAAASDALARPMKKAR